MTTVSPLAETKPKPKPEIIIAPFAAEHIAGALRLSQEADWPHRAQDWQMVLSVSEGVVALADGEVVGTALCTCFGDVASVNMIIVDARMRGRGLGRRLMERVLELGGKSPMVVFADADLDLAAECLDKGIMPNAGQFCVAGSRILVEESIVDALAERLTNRFARYTPADTLADTLAADAGFSPIISSGQLARIDSIVQASVSQGADLLCGGKAFDREGSYYQPTLITGVTQDNPAVTEEIFGPVATFQTFKGEDEAMAMAAHQTYGLAAGLFTRDLSRALRLSRRIEAGTIWVNRYGRSRDHILPTGGWKASGLGKDLGREAYLANRRSKSVLIDL